MRIIISVIALIILITTVPLNTVGDMEVKNERIAYEDHYTDWLYGIDKGDTIKGELISDKPVDLYIISNDQFWGGYTGTKGFASAYQLQNVTNTKFEWTEPDDQLYVIVIDNEFNGNGADPTGDVTISYSRNDPYQESVDSGWSFLCGLIITIIVIVVVVIILVIYFVVRKKKQPTPQQGYQTYPQQPQYQQPQYQQPQQQPYQPPQQPPPQSPPQQPPQYPPQY